MTASPPLRLISAVQRVIESVIHLVQSRIVLFGAELTEEKLRALRLLGWLGLAFVLGATGVLIILAALALFAWNRAGYVGLGLLAGGCLTLTTIIAWSMWHKIKTGPMPFAATANEFRKDLEWFHHQ